MTKQTTTLEFQGQKIMITFQDGQHWVAIKPICRLLKWTYYRART
jgi:prophage antirepressor-like protein